MAVRAQRLTADRPDDLRTLLEDLTFVQVEPTAAVAPTHHLVCWSRLGSSYRTADLDHLQATQEVVELRGCLRPASQLAPFRAEMAAWPGRPPLRSFPRSLADWVAANDACRRDLLERLRMDGPLPASELPDTCVRPWRSSGWNNHQNVRILLDLMVQRGEVAVAGRDGPHRLWDLAERVYPDEPLPSLDEAERELDERRLAALGIARPRGPACPVEPLDVGEAGEPATIDGVRGEWRVDPAHLDGPFRGRAALLSPFDRLLADRKRMSDLFEFEYALEMFKPKAKRRWGYYALPILYGDRLVGKLDATADRSAGVLRVHAVHEDEPWSKTGRAAIEREIRSLAAWLELDVG